MGRHSVSVGVSFLQVAAVQRDRPGGVVRTVTFGVSSADPAYAMLTPSSGNFPGGISDTDAGYARNLYALLTGRVTQVSGTAVLGGDGLYALSGERIRKARQEQLGVFAGDAWRLRPT